VKLVCISDTHNFPLSKLDLPEGDLLIHAGDATRKGSEGEVNAFNRELGLVKHRYTHGIVFTPGNHDWYFEKKARYVGVGGVEAKITNARCLIHKTVVVDGLRIFMSPYTPWFNNWAFNVKPGPLMKKLWSDIPHDTDVLVTHGPPLGVLDIVPPDYRRKGCEALTEAVKKLNLKLHVFGHIHASYGMVEKWSRYFINCCIMDESYHRANAPVEWEI